MQDINLTKKYSFYDLPEEILDELHGMISPLLTPTAIESFTKGHMTIMDWKYKFDMLIDLIV